MTTGVSIDPARWGRDVWSGMHWIVAGYPSDPSIAEQLAAARYFQSVGLLLPCSVCRENYAIHTKDDPVEAHTHSGEALRAWLLKLHNTVSRSINPTARTWTIEEMNRKFCQPPEQPQALAGPPPQIQQIQQPVPRPAVIRMAPNTFGSVSGTVQPTPTISQSVASRRITRQASRGVVYSTSATTASPTRSRATKSTVPQPKKKGCGCRKG